MANSSDLFSEFPPVSKAEWLAQITKDLKGKDIDSTTWRISDEMAVSPLVHADDFTTPPAPMDVQSGWEIGEKVDTADPQAANGQILEALAFGAQGIHLHLEQPLDTEAFDTVLAGVHLEYIGLHFGGPGVTANPGAVLAGLHQLAAVRGVDTTTMKGSLLYNPGAASGLQDWRYLFDLMAYAGVEFPGFTVAGVDGRALSQGTGEVPEEIAAILRRGNLCLEKLIERGTAPEAAAGQLVFHMGVRNSYFMEIAKMRAFQLLWLHVLQAWEAPLQYPVITAHVAAEAYSDELFTNMISATTVAMSAVLGGARRIVIPPYDTGREDKSPYPPAFGRRIARNVQHLLQLESGFDELADPAAGSYYIEQLTRMLAEKAWEKFTAK